MVFRFFPVLIATLFFSANAFAQTRGIFSYNVAQLQYAPANLDVARSGRDWSKSMDKLTGYSIGSDLGFGENGAGEILWSNKSVISRATDSAGKETQLKLRVNTASMGGAFGTKYARLGLSTDVSVVYVAYKGEEGGWKSVYGETKRKFNFGGTAYASFILPLADVMFLEVRPYYQSFLFTTRYLHGLDLYTVKPENYGVMFIMGFGGYMD